MNLRNVIDYQKEAIVSKEILKKPSGTVTMFSFDINQGLSEHTAPFDALVYIIEGKAEITISGESYSVGAGEIIVMPANEPHSLKAGERFKMLLTMIKD